MRRRDLSGAVRLSFSECGSMSAEVLGISGSPVPNSNTDRAVKQILEHTGLMTEFVKLSELDMSPCHACLGCVQDNECVVRDDGRDLARRFREAKAFVLGAFTPYSSLDARTKTFMERMYCFRHRIGGNARKFGAAVITTACPPGAEGLPPAAETATSQIAFWMPMMRPRRMMHLQSLSWRTKRRRDSRQFKLTLREQTWILSSHRSGNLHLMVSMASKTHEKTLTNTKISRVLSN